MVNHIHGEHKTNKFSKFIVHQKFDLDVNPEAPRKPVWEQCYI